LSGVSTEGAAKDSGAVAADASGRGNEGRSAIGGASKNDHTSASSTGGNSSGRGGIPQLGFWLSVFFAALLLIPVVIWVVVKSVRSQEESQDNEVVYKNLNVLQIYGRITKKY